MPAWFSISNVMKLIRLLFEIMGGVIIVATVTIAFGLISLLFYMEWQIKNLSLAMTLLGFILGMIWAVRIGKKYGTLEWLPSIRRVS
jgi:hypothetical protein